MNFKTFIFIFIFFYLFYFLVPSETKGDLSCTFYGEVISVSVGSVVNVTLSVTNEGPADASRVKFTNERGVGLFKIVGGNASGWNVSLDGENIVFFGNKLTSSQTGYFNLEIRGLAETLEDTQGINVFLFDEVFDFIECSGGRGILVLSSTPAPQLQPTSTPSTQSSLTSQLSLSQDRTESSNTSDNSNNASALVRGDYQKPSVYLTNNFSSSFDELPLLRGKVLDFQESSLGIRSVYYSTDGGKNWLPVGNLRCQSLVDCSFSFTPELYDDGNYKIQIRAIDIANNIGYSPLYTLVIDRLPPQIGPIFFILGNLIIKPDGNVFRLVSGLEYKIRFKTVGGTTDVSLLVGDKIFKGSKNEEGNFWEVLLKTDEPGDYPFKAVLIDGAGNRTERDLGKIVVNEKGKIRGEGRLINKGEMKVYAYSSLVSKFVLWNGADFYQQNPVRLKDGEYSLLLPPGKYYLEVYSSGFRTWQSNIFELSRYYILNEDINLEKKEGFRLGFINLPLDFTVTRGKISVLQDRNIDHPLEGKEMPDIGLILKERLAKDFDISGKRFLLSFLSTYHPQTSIQLNLLNQSDDDYLWVVVFPQEQDYFIRVYKKRGLYRHYFVADQDGALFARFSVLTTPLHFLIDERGVIIDVEEGLIDNNYLKDVFNLID